MSENEHADPLPDYALVTLYEMLDLAEYLLDIPCVQGVSPFSVQNGFENDCAVDSHSVTLAGPVSCHVSSSCTAVDCCLSSQKLGRTFRTSLQLLPCKQCLIIGIEKYQFTLNMIDYNYGEQDHFWLNGAIRMDFILFNLEERNEYVLNLALSVCLEDGGDCEFVTSIFDNKALTKTPCSLNQGYKADGISATTWLAGRGLDFTDDYPVLVHSELMEYMGMSKYLLEEECSVTGDRYDGNLNGWVQECFEPAQLPDLPDNLRASFSSDCSVVQACLFVDKIKRSFDIALELDSCASIMTLTIERHSAQVTLSDYEFGTWVQFYLYGVIRLEVMLVDFEGGYAYSTTVKLLACVDDGEPCYLDEILLDRVSVPKAVCDFGTDTAFRVDEFSLLEWRSKYGLSLDGPLPPVYVNILLAYLGVSRYLHDTPCVQGTEWQNACSSIGAGELETLPDFVSGDIPADCSRVDLCMEDTTLLRNIHFYIIFHTCTLEITVGIEELQFTIPFKNMNWGVFQRIHFGGMFRLDYSIKHLENEKKYLVNADIHVCFETRASCVHEFTVLRDALFEKEDCDWRIGFVDPEFSYQTWSAVEGVSEPLDSYHSNKLLEHLHVVSYLQDDQCSLTYPLNGQWETDECGFTVDFPPLPSYMSCRLSSSCTQATCCMNVESIGRSFEVNFNVDPCTYSLTVGVENFGNKELLFDMPWGTELHFWLFGLVRVDYKVYNLVGERKFLSDLDVSLCLESSADCLYVVHVLSDSLMPKSQCDWNFDYYNPELILTSWYQSYGLSPANPLEPKYNNILQDALGLTAYMSDSCSVNLAPYTTSDGGWNLECGSSVDVLDLPPGTSCHISDCTLVECCFPAPVMQRNVYTVIDIDSCKKKLTIGIEKLQFTVDLLTFKFGVEFIIALEGVFRVTATIDDLVSEGNYMMSLDISVCYDAHSPCEYTETILRNTRLPKPVCDWETWYIDPAFSLTTWIQTNSLVEGNLDTLSQSLLLEELGAASYMNEDLCNPVLVEDQWDTAACPLDVDLPGLSGPVSCALDSTCKGITCCMESVRINRAFQYILNINACDMKLTFGIEKLQFDISLLEYVDGTTINFYLYGAVRMSFSLEYLPDKSCYIVNMAISICLEAQDDCDITKVVLENALLPILPCNYDTGFKIPGFSLTDWLQSKGYPYGTFLGEDVTSQLLEVLCLTGYLQTTQCGKADAIYQPNVKGWSKTCLSGVSVPTLPSVAACNLLASCTGVDCCVQVYLLEKGFHVQLNIDPCEEVLDIMIERLPIQIGFDEFEMGTSQRICLFGVICIELLINDLYWEEIYIVDMTLEICLETGADCYPSVQVLQETVLPKTPCSWDSGHIISDWVLTPWLSAAGVPYSTPLPAYMGASLTEHLGLSPFMLDVPCDRQSEPLSLTTTTCYTGGCSFPPELSALTYDKLSCYIPPTCTGISVCADVPVLGRSVSAHVELDDCTQILKIGIENYKFEVVFADIEFGVPYQFYLKGAIRFDMLIRDVATVNVYVVDLEFSLCFESSTVCETVETLFDQTTLYRTPCTWDALFIHENASLSQWLADKQITRSDLDSIYMFQLQEDFGFAAYLQETECYQLGYPYTPSGGWNQDQCSVDLSLSGLPDSTFCYVLSSCTAIDCCVSVELLQSTVHFFLNIDACNSVLYVGIERLQTSIDLVGYEWGLWEKFYMVGVYRMDYKIENLQQGRKFVVSINCSICFESAGPCEDTIVVLEDFVLPKTECDWNTGFVIPGFDLDDWLLENSYSNTVPLSDFVVIMLVDTLQIGSYLLDEQCSSGVAPFIPTTGNWNKDPSCTSAMSLPTLDDSVVCYIPASCTGISCCVDVERLAMAFTVMFDIDDCGYRFSVGIENLQFTRSLFNFGFDVIHIFDLNGLIKLEFLISDLELERKYLMSARVKVCFSDSKPCDQEVVIFDNVLVSKRPCEYDATYLKPNTSLTEWKTSNNLDPAEPLDSYHQALFFEDIQIAEYLLLEPCTLLEDTWDASACSMSLDLPEVPEDTVSSTIPSTCTGVTSCVHSEEVGRNFQVSVEIITCARIVIVKLEQMEFEIPFEDYPWGNSTAFYLFGAVRVEFSVTVPLEDRLYSMDMEISLCFNPTEDPECSTSVTIFNNTWLYILPCSWSEGFVDPDFSFTLWKSLFGFSGLSPLPTDVVTKFLSDIQVGTYLLDTQCNIATGLYSGATNGWKTAACSQSVSFQDLPEDIATCYLTSCTEFHCCVKAVELQRSFQAIFAIDPCSSILTVGIESVSVEISLEEENSDAPGRFYINGFLRLDYIVIELTMKSQYFVSLNISICLEANQDCDIIVHVLNETLLPKGPCDWSTGFLDQNFYITEWLEDHVDPVPAEGETLAYIPQTLLLDDLGLTLFTLEPTCEHPGGTERWTNECTSVNTTTLPGLSDTLTCTLVSSCTLVTCCMDTTWLGKTVHFQFNLDKCDTILTVQIETYSWSMNLFQLDSGREYEADLFGVLRMKFTVEELVYFDEYIISVSLSECYKFNDTCNQDITVLDELLVPIQPCPLERGYADSGFSLTRWMAANQVYSLPVTQSMAEVLKDDLEVTRFFSAVQCSQDATRYVPDTDLGWNVGDCQSQVAVSNLTGSDAVCHLDSTCNQVDCCVNIPDLGTTLRIDFYIRTCDLILEVGIEELKHNIPLTGFNWGTPYTVDFNGFFRIQFTLNKLTDSETKTYVASILLEVCWESSGACGTTIPVLEGALLPIETCLFGPEYAAPDFSLDTFVSNTTTPLSHRDLDNVLNELGLKYFLMEDYCEGNELTSLSDFSVITFNESLVTCVQSDTMFEVICCAESEVLQRNFKVQYLLDPCNYAMSIEVENIEFPIQLLGYAWGTRHAITTKGVARGIMTVNNIQSTKQFNIDVSLKICPDPMGSCNLTVTLFQSHLLDYPTNCVNFTANNTDNIQPYFDISHDFWKIPSAENFLSTDTSDCPTITLPEFLHGICKVEDCQTITCVIDTFFYTARINLYVQFQLSCDTFLNYKLEKKSWQKNLAVLAKDTLHEHKIGSALKLQYSVSEAAASYSINATLVVCTGTEYSCQDVQFLIDQELKKPDCSVRRRRRRRSAESSTEDDIQAKIRELIAAGVEDSEIQQYVEEVKAREEAERESNFEVEPLGDGEKSVSNKGAVKAMGSKNPNSLGFSKNHGHATSSVTVESTESILNFFDDVSDIAGRAEQIFIVGKGLSKEGTKLLGEQLAGMTIGDLEAMLETNKVDPFLVQQIVKDFIELAKAIYSEFMDKAASAQIDSIFKMFDLTITGSFNFPRKDITFFTYSQIFPLGGFITVLFEFGAGGYYGMDVGLSANIVGMSLGAELLPYGGLTCYGSVAIGNIIYAKMLLEGDILNLQFPTNAEIMFSKFPFDVAMTMDLELIPLKLKLSAQVTIEIKIPLVGAIREVVFEKALWKYQTPLIKKRIINVSTKQEDESPPQFSPVVQEPISKRAVGNVGSSACDVEQIANQDYTEPGFQISVAASDDKSDLKLFLDIGTFPAGNDVIEREELGGEATVMMTTLDVTGKPLYFTVNAENKAGTGASVTCSLPTYDVTLPTGRMMAEFTSSSNPTTVKATFVGHDDSEITSAFVGVGYGKGSYGDQVHAWTQTSLTQRRAASDSGEPLDNFSDYRDGRLVVEPVRSIASVQQVQHCARLCLEEPNDHCLSINFDFGPDRTCELLNAIEGDVYHISVSGQFSHYERLDVGHVLEFAYHDMFLEHNFLYFVNLDLTNVLGYRQILSSRGILVDFTPPDTRQIVNASTDILETIDCESAIPDDREEYGRACVGVDPSVENHRIIIDGPGSTTVFNGGEAMTDLMYTRYNNYIEANWDGFEDNETDILVYSWTVGYTVCDDEIHPHHDPHKHLLSSSSWNNKGIIPVIPEGHNPLPDGDNYISVRAINKVEHGGPLSTTVCHSTPLIVDTSKPFVHEIFDITYDEDDFILSMQQNSSDPHSGIASVSVCLGRTRYDCSEMDWYQHVGNDPFVNQAFKLSDGVRTWVRLRAINNVELAKVGVANQPIMVDITDPFAGVVNDGATFRVDQKYSKDADQMCVNWLDFYDPDSGISGYKYGIGSEPGLHDVAGLIEVPYTEYKACITLDSENLLEHGETYYNVIWAANGGINQRNISSVSDGVMIDLTPPVEGTVIDGDIDGFTDLAYSASTARVSLQWQGFFDPESGIDSFSVKVLRDSGEGYETLRDFVSLEGNTTEARWQDYHLHHKDRVKSVLKTTNGALNEIESETDSFIVDLTPPSLDYIGDGATPRGDIEYQSDLDSLSINFNFYDLESTIFNYKLQVYELRHGTKSQILPEALNEWVDLNANDIQMHTQTGMSLTVGHMYIARIAAVNGAGLESTYDTNGVIIDNTPPVIKWLNVGVLGGEEEEILGGYVWQSDHAGIKATWLASDPESGVGGVAVAVGTSPGGVDIQDWLTVEGKIRDYYIPCALTDTDQGLNPPSPVYYVSLKVKNGAGNLSAPTVSTPVIVVPEDVTGIATDGPYEGFEHDIDYQSDTNTVTMRFSGFESSLHGISAFDWSIGTRPDCEDITPFMEHGIVHNEEDGVPGHGVATSGLAQAVLPLTSGVTYCTTVRAITNGGNILQTVTDGFTPDITPPYIELESLSNSNSRKKREMNTAADDLENIYQYTSDVLTEAWEYSDDDLNVEDVYDNIASTWYSVGTYPSGDDIKEKTELPLTPNLRATVSAGDVTPAVQGIANMFTVGASNKVGLEEMVYSAPVIIDTTNPVEGTITCPSYVQGHSSIDCIWNDFIDDESPIDMFVVSFGTQKGYDDIYISDPIPGYQSRYSTTEVSKAHGDVFYGMVTAYNSVGLSVSSFSEAITVDDTPPTAGMVVELTSIARIDPYNNDATVNMNLMACQTEEVCEQIDVICQESLTSINVAWIPFEDLDSQIAEYQLAVGTTAGAAQILPFFSIPADVNNYLITGLNLLGERQAFVTVKGINGAGLATSSSSNGVYMSYLSQGLDPLTPTYLWDADPLAPTDIQFQVDDNVIRAKWDVSGDPCPVVSYEWAIERTDGLVIQNFTDMAGKTEGENDQVELEMGVRYYSLVKVTNSFGYSYTLRSDGVTISAFALIPGIVYDGDHEGYDFTVLPSTGTVTGNWDKFGDAAPLENVAVKTGNDGVEVEPDIVDMQEVSYYEVALGTDRRFPNTRDNVVPFTNVGKNKTVTFTHLNLVRGTAKYYFSVKAYSATYSTALAVSNGFYVSEDAGVTAGKINMADYIANQHTYDIQWDSFYSAVDIMMYYVAMSNHTGADTAGTCRDYIHEGSSANTELKAELFNVYEIINVGESTFVTLDGLDLTQSESYFVWVIAIDKGGECAMVSHKFTVDITPPEDGEILSGPYAGMVVAYAEKASEVAVRWTGFEDPDSGIDHYLVTLWNAGLCSANPAQGDDTEEQTVLLDGSHSEYTFTNLSLAAHTRYHASIIAVNRATLVNSAETSNIVYDPSSPVAGHVAEGTVFNEDIIWWGSADYITGSILHMPSPTEDPCPQRPGFIRNDFGDWSTINMAKMKDPHGIDWYIEHRAANIIKENLTDDVVIKLARDSKADKIYSAAYWRSADFENGGTYEIAVKAADGYGYAVTGVTFWDGETDGLDDLQIFNYMPEPDWTQGQCACCYQDPIPTECPCDCDDFLGNLEEDEIGVVPTTRAVTTTTAAPPADQGVVVGDDDEVSSLQEGGAAPKLVVQRSCGLQLMAGEEDNAVIWCRFYEEKLQTMKVKASLNFDPSEDFHHYLVSFIPVKEDITTTWVMLAYADGHLFAEMPGVPELSTSTKLVLHAWNKNNFLPEIDNVFAIWEARASFKDVYMPPEPGTLCRFGDPFKGGTNAIVKYEAGLGNATGVDNFVPFREAIVPCIPCTTPCSVLNCDETCGKSGYEQLTFNLTDLNLDLSYTGTYYLTVKAVLGSGSSAWASSNGFYIDITPPVFNTKIMLYIDVRQGDFFPNSFQGSNNTIKAVWLCEDGESEIEEYEWSIGTTVGGDDIQSFVSTGENATAANSDLEGVIEHNTTYYVSVRCTNAAGLATVYNDEKGVTVLLIPPDPESVEASAVGAETFDHPVEPATAMKSEDPTTVGEHWEVSEDPNVDRYYFCVGSSMESIEDIVPCIVCSLNTSGEAKIEDGYFKIDNIQIYKVSEIKALSTDGSYNPDNDTDSSDAFIMEPGRTMFVNMKLCNKAKICNTKFVNSVVVTNENSKLVTSTDGEKLELAVGPPVRRRKRELPAITVQTPSGLVPGQSIMVNELTEAEMTATYTSGASFDFVSYISNPADSMDLVERLLYGRFLAVNASFTIVPIGHEAMPGPLLITYEQTKFDPEPSDPVSMLLHWNPVLQVWQMSSRSCIAETDQSVDNVTEGTVTVKVCDTRIDPTTANVSNPTNFSVETQFAVSTVLAGIVNDPPILLSQKNISIDEDSGTMFYQLEAEDPEGDSVTFSISYDQNSDILGTLSVTEAGGLTLKPCAHCSSEINVTIEMHDHPILAEIPPSTGTDILTINVLDKNDAPSIHLFDQDGNVLLSEDKTEPIVVYCEQDGMGNIEFNGTLVAFDVDVAENLTLIYNRTANGTFELIEIDRNLMDQFVVCGNGLCQGEIVVPNLDNMAWLGSNITYTPHPEFIGIDMLQLVIQDRWGTFSDVVTIKMVVMENKCQNGGQCESKVPETYTCDSTLRTVSFDDYYNCSCASGWEGEHCETDIDECSHGVCGSGEICTNLNGTYECTCKPGDVLCNSPLKPWAIALICIGCLAVVAAGVVFIIRRCTRKTEDYSVNNLWRAFAVENRAPLDTFPRQRFERLGSIPSEKKFGSSSVAPLRDPLKPKNNLSKPFVDVEYGSDKLVDPLSKPGWALKNMMQESALHKSKTPELQRKAHWVVNNGRAERIPGPEIKKSFWDGRIFDGQNDTEKKLSSEGEKTTEKKVLAEGQMDTEGRSSAERMYYDQEELDRLVKNIPGEVTPTPSSSRATPEY